MRRAMLFFIILFLLVTSYWLLVTDSYAAPCYGTKMPKKREFFTGLQGHAIFKRHLENEYGKLRSTQQFLLLSYGVYDWLSIDLKGGSGNIKQRPFGNDEVDYPSSFAGGYGFRLRLYDSGKTKMVFGFQHISVHPQSVHLGITKNKAVLDDWQSSFLVSYEFGKITPYLGTKWSRIDYIHWVEENRKRKISDSTEALGLVFGLDISVAKQFWLNLEGQVFDVEACALSVNFSF